MFYSYKNRPTLVSRISIPSGYEDDVGLGVP